jgi:membrane protein DedA with SNARE-associated domain
MPSGLSSLSDAVSTLGVPGWFIDIFVSYPYAIIFVSLLIGGGIILFPAFYLSLTGELTLWYIIGTMALAAVVSDGFWYGVGRGTMPKFLERYTKRRRTKYLEKASDFIAGRELVMVFYSKFVFGTRIAAQVICGARKVSFLSFLGVNILGVIVIGFIYYGVVRFTWMSVSSMDDLKMKLFIAVPAMAAILGMFHFVAYRLIKGSGHHE